MTERIDDLADALAIRLILGFSKKRRAQVGSPLGGHVNFGNDNVNRHRRTSKRSRASDTNFRKLVRYEKAGAIDFQGHMADWATRLVLVTV